MAWKFGHFIGALQRSPTQRQQTRVERTAGRAFVAVCKRG